MTKAEERRIEQEAINEQIESLMEEMNTEATERGTLYRVGRRLRRCTAEVYDTPNFYILRSYNTVIAGIDKRTDTIFDFLRKVYGYTASSAQHIRKFDRDYGDNAWGCTHRLTWYDAQ